MVLGRITGGSHFPLLIQFSHREPHLGHEQALRDGHQDWQDHLRPRRLAGEEGPGIQELRGHEAAVRLQRVWHHRPLRPGKGANNISQ